MSRRAELTSSDTGTTGHLGTPLKEIIAESVDSYGFMMQELGMKYRPIANAAGAEGAPQKGSK